ncbi:hypothetical protein SIO70_00635 [Chitinophaga sancti]|uniref:hypothetical protein n=1 Tax=Chitinophaga sancti TaxID=1004 RepID=UPI002A766962|nr:hypothetical protein [Chitinophaga sancti]WPQ63367.1 hypothetical protein SIO70_00635 [Chitinophaga sancti]
MTKARIIFSAMCTLGITGSIFAFKISQKNHTVLPYYITTAYCAAANLTYTNGTATTKISELYRYFTLEKGAKACIGARIIHGV